MGKKHRFRWFTHEIPILLDIIACFAGLGRVEDNYGGEAREQIEKILPHFSVVWKDSNKS